jgi:hypothetical protein
MLPARRISSSNTENILYTIRMTVTRSNGLVVTSDCFRGTTLGSSLHSVEVSYPLSSIHIVKILIFFIRVFFNSKKYA